MHKVKSGVQNMHIYIAKNFLHEGATVFIVVFRWSSYLTTTVRSSLLVSLHAQCYTCQCISGNKWIIFLNIKTSNSDETGPGERTREGDHRLKDWRRVLSEAL